MALVCDLQYLISMQTKCPACKTVFHLTEAQASAASGMTQCGVCHHYFNALGSRVDTISRKAGSYSLKDMLVLKSRDLAAKDLFASLKNAYVHKHPGAPWWTTTLWTLLILLSLAAVLAQLAWFHREALSAREELRPYVLMACERLPCELKQQVSLEQIELLNRDVRSHPAIKGALLITATFINHADFEQPYPKIGLRLSALNGEIIARRYFEPEEYLKKDYQASSLMGIDLPVTMIMEVVDPGREAVSYRFDFL